MESLNMIPPEPQPRYDPKCDTWSLGMVAACAALDLPRGPWPNLKLPQIVRKLLSLGDYQGRRRRSNICSVPFPGNLTQPNKFCQYLTDKLATQGNVLERIARECDRGEQLRSIPSAVRDVIDACLQPELEKRPSADELLREKFPEDTLVDEGNMFTFPTLRLRCNDLDGLTDADGEEDDEEHPLDVLTIQVENWKRKNA